MILWIEKTYCKHNCNNVMWLHHWYETSASFPGLLGIISRGLMFYVMSIVQKGSLN